MKKKLVVLFAAALAVMTVLGGCGTDSKSAGDGSLSAETENTVADEEIPAETLLAATDYDIKDYVKLMDGYMGMDVTLTSDYSVTDEAIKEYIENYIIPYYPMYNVSDKTTVESGDTVDIDFEGKKDGEAFDGGTAEGYKLEIGSNSFIDGFEDGLIGKEVGGTYDLDLTFPENYTSEELAGQDVVFTVTINSIVEAQDATYDDLTDDYVASNFSSYGMNTMDDLNANIRTQLESDYESDKTYDVQSEVIRRLKEESEITMPEGLLDERIASSIESIKEQAASSEMEYDEYVTQYYGESAEDLEREIQESMEDQLIQELVLEAVVEDQGVSITTSAFDSFVSTYVSSYGFADEEEFYSLYGGKEQVQLIFAEGEALNLVKNAANVIEAPAADTETEE